MTLYHYAFQALRVIDGDTFEALVDLGFRTIRRETFRLARINAYERGTDLGDAARIRLGGLVFAAGVTLTSVKTEKYGRYLAEVYIGDRNVNDLLVEEGLARWYPEPKP